jgi:RNA-directed DNA polymerase
MQILEKYIPDKAVIGLLHEVVRSFRSTTQGKGLPLGNLTSQLLVNIYMNEFDQFVKHTLQAKYYIRYADDFIILSQSREDLLKLLSYMIVVLRDRLQLQLHPHKVSIETVVSGVDFLGWVQFPHHRVLRRVTRRRVVKKLQEPDIREAAKQSYIGLLSHGNAHELLCLYVQTTGKII